MTIPNSIRIAGIEYEISYDPALRDGSVVQLGHIEYAPARITLNSRELSAETMPLTLWHEVMHALVQGAGLDLGEDEERIVELLSRGVWQVLADNVWRLFPPPLPYDPHDGWRGVDDDDADDAGDDEDVGDGAGAEDDVQQPSGRRTLPDEATRISSGPNTTVSASGTAGCASGPVSGTTSAWSGSAAYR